MANPFPDHPNLRGGYAPIQMECDAPNLIIEGEIPAELNGTLYRIGPNPQFAPRGQYHWFAGDGMIHSFKISNRFLSHLSSAQAFCRLIIQSIKWYYVLSH